MDITCPKNIKIDYQTTCEHKKHLNSVGYNKKSDSTFHSVTITFRKGMGGITDIEIENIWSQVLIDYKRDIIIAACMGIEGTGEGRHLHLPIIYKDTKLTGVTQKKYVALIDKSRIEYAAKDAKNIQKCITIKTVQPATAKMETYRAYRWLSYGLKEMAKSYNDLCTFKQAVDFTDGPNYRSIGIFNDGDVDNSTRKNKLAEFIFSTWDTKTSKRCSSSNISFNDNLPNLVMEFTELVGIDLPWIVENDSEATVANQTKILYLMVMHRGDQRYLLTKSFFNKQNKKSPCYRHVFENLIVNKPLPNQSSQAYNDRIKNAIHQQVAIRHKVQLVTKATHSEIRRLEGLVGAYQSNLEDQNVELKEKEHLLHRYFQDIGLLQRENNMLREKCGESERWMGIPGDMWLESPLDGPWIKKRKMRQ